MRTIKTNKTNKPFSFYKEGFISLFALLHSNKLLWSIPQTSLVLGGGSGWLLLVLKDPSGKEGGCEIVLSIVVVLVVARVYSRCIQTSTAGSSHNGHISGTHRNSCIPPPSHFAWSSV